MIDIKITPDGGDTVDVKITARDFLPFERVSRRTFGQVMESPSMVDMYHLAWIAARRLGLYEGDLKTFETSIELGGFDDMGGEPDPTPPEASIEPSSGSRSQPASRTASGRARRSKTSG